MGSIDGVIGFRVAFKHLGQIHFLHSNSVLDIDRLGRFGVLPPTRQLRTFEA